MKKILRICILVAVYVGLILGFLNLIGTITTQWNWTSLSVVLLMIFTSIEQFSIKGEPNKIKNARVLGIIMLLACALNLLVFIKSVLK